MNFAIGEAERNRARICPVKRWNPFILFGLFCLLYNPAIFRFNLMHLVGALSILYLLLRFERTVQMVRSVAIGGVWLAAFIWLVYLLLIILMNSEDLVSVAVPIYFAFEIIPFGMSVRIVLEDHGWDVEDFINMVIAVAVIQGILAAAAFISPEVQNFFVQKCLDHGYGEVIIELAKHRFYGFSAGLTFDMPILQTVVAMLVLYPMGKQTLVRYIIAALLFVSGIINARNALIIAIIGFFVMIVLSKLSIKQKVLCCIALLVLLLLIMIIGIPVLASISPETYEWVITGGKEILDFVSGEKATSGYFSYITDPDKYRLPGGVIEVLFGVGHRTMGMTERYGYGSDIGYVNDLWLGGIVYMIPLYLFFALLMIKLWKNENNRVSFIGMLYLVMYPFVNIKGIAASANAFSYFLFFLYIVVVDYKYAGNSMDARR